MTPEQAAALFLKLTAEHTDIDPASLDHAAIIAKFREIFNRGAA